MDNGDGVGLNLREVRAFGEKGETLKQCPRGGMKIKLEFWWLKEFSDKNCHKNVISLFSSVPAEKFVGLFLNLTVPELLHPHAVTQSSTYHHPDYPEVNIEFATTRFFSVRSWVFQSSARLPSSQVHWRSHRGTSKWWQHVSHTGTWRKFTLACHWLRHSCHSQKGGDLQPKWLLWMAD